MRASISVARGFVYAVAGLVAMRLLAETPEQRSWDPKAAAAYLDSRALAS